MPNLTDRCDGFSTDRCSHSHHGRCGFAPAPRHVSPRCAGRPRSAHTAPAARTGFPHLGVLRVLSAGDHPRIGPNSSRSPELSSHCGALIAHGRKSRIDPVSRFQPTKISTVAAGQLRHVRLGCASPHSVESSLRWRRCPPWVLSRQGSCSETKLSGRSAGSLVGV